MNKKEFLKRVKKNGISAFVHRFGSLTPDLAFEGEEQGFLIDDKTDTMVFLPIEEEILMSYMLGWFGFDYETEELIDCWNLGKKHSGVI